MSTSNVPDESEEINPFSVFTTFFPYSIGIILFISAARQYLINREFGLPIFTYLETSDLTTGILNDLYGLFPFLFFSLVLMFLKNFLRKGLGHTASCLGLGISLSLFAFVATMYWGHQITNFSTHYWCCVSIYFGLCSAAYAYKSLQRTPNRWVGLLGTVSNRTLLLSMILIFSYLFCKSLSTYVVYELKVRKHTKGTVITFKDTAIRPIISNDTLYYFGNTTKFVFAFNEKTQKCIAYPMESIVSVAMVR